MDWKHYQTVGPPKERHRLVGDCFGVRVSILHFNFQFSKSIKFSTFHLFLNLTYPLREISIFQNAKKSHKNSHKTAKQRLWL